MASISMGLYDPVLPLSVTHGVPQERNRPVSMEEERLPEIAGTKLFCDPLKDLSTSSWPRQ